MSRARRAWLTAAVLLVAVGAVGSVLGASVMARNDAQRSKAAFVSSSMAIASSLKLAIQQENSLVISAKSFILTNPNASNTEFLSWVTSMQVATRFPEVDGLGYFAVVRPDQLSQFVARILTDPPAPIAAGQPYQVTPPGTRPFYCLSDLEFINRGQALSLPLSYDVCAANAAQNARVFANDTYTPYKMGNTNYLSVGAPVYVGGVEPATAQARAATVQGIVGLTTKPSFDLQQALVGHPGTAVAFSYGAGSSKVTFRAGSAPAGSS